MAESSGLREVGYFDCPGSAQVMVDGTIAYVGHLAGPAAVSIVDVADPANPCRIGTLEAVHPVAGGHMARAKDGLIVTNFEVAGHPDPASVTPRGGISVIDATDPADPQPMVFWQCGGPSVGRFSFDGRFAFISPEVDGYDGNICMIVDLDIPNQPEELGRWHVPGQWHGGGEQRSWPAGQVRCHHPIQFRTHLYVGCWHAGWSIVNIADMHRPCLLSGGDRSAPNARPTNACVPVTVGDRDIMVVADAGEAAAQPPGPATLRLFDITDGAHPTPFSSFQVNGFDGSGAAPPAGGCKPADKISGTEVPVAWSAHGLRLIDVADPAAPKEAARFVPEPHNGAGRVQSSDVCTDKRDLIYLTDRAGGLHILERV